MSELIVNDLTVKYGNVVAVDHLDLHAAEGQFMTLLGPSGCGKTTTLRCIAGLEPRSGGEIRIGDEVVSGPSREVAPEARNINMVFQTYAVWPHMTVYANVAFGLRLRKLPKQQIRQRVDEVLRLVGLETFADRYGTELSGGQQQRVALARAIVTEPRLLLFDEPLSNLDASLREQMRLELRELHQRIGKTALYVTHDQVEAMVMSDVVVLMKDGRIVQAGPPDELYERPRSRFAAEFLGTANVWDAALVGAETTPARYRARLSEGELELTVTTPPGAAASIGALGAVGVRAERVRVDARAAGGGQDGTSWPGTVERMAYLGSCFELHVRVGDHIVRAEAAPGIGLRPGDEATVTIPADAAVWLVDDLPAAGSSQQVPSPALG